MKQLILPLLITSVMGLSACCECEVPESRYHQHDNATKDETATKERHGHHQEHNKHGRHGNHDQKTHHSNKNDGKNELKAHPQASATAIPNLMLDNHGWKHEHGIVGKGILNLLDRQKMSSISGKLSKHRFSSTKDTQSFSKQNFDQSVTEYMNKMGAVEFFNRTLSTSEVSKLEKMTGFSSSDYFDINPTKHPVRQFSAQSDKGNQVIYQVLSDENLGEIGVFYTDKPTQLSKPISEDSAETISQHDAEQKTAESTTNTDTKPNIQAKINPEPVEVPTDIKESEVTKPKIVDEPVQADDSNKPVSSQEMQSQLGKSGAITLHINFDTSKATIRNDNLYIIEELNKLLREYPNLKFIIRGHTDDVGDAEMNQKLSLARAREVKAELEKKGIDSTRLKTAGFGESQPIVKNDSNENRARNRRVELVQF